MSQTEPIQSLETAVASAQTDAEKAHALAALAAALQHTQIDRAYTLATEALAIARRLNDEATEASSLLTLSRYALHAAAYTLAIEQSEAAQRLFTRLNDRNGVAAALAARGQASWHLSDNASALECHQDSLHLYRETGNALGVATVLIHLGNVYFNLSDNAQALKFYQESLSMHQDITRRDAPKSSGDAEPERTAEGVATALNGIGNVYFRLADYGRTLESYQEALRIYRRLGIERRAASILSNIGNVYFNLSDYAQALKFYQESLGLNQTLHNTLGVGLSMTHIGNVYFMTADYSQALRCYQESLSIHKRLGTKRHIGEALNSIGGVYHNLADYPRAFEAFQESLTIHQNLLDQQNVATALNGIGSVYFHLADHRRALEYYQACLSIRKDIGDQRGIAGVLTQFGEAVLLLARYDEAETYFTQALALCEPLGLKQEKYEALELLADLYARTRQFEKAFETYKRFHAAKEDVFNEESDRKTRNLQVLHDTEQAQRQAEISQQQAELSQKQTELERLRNVELAQALSDAEALRRIAEDASAFKTDLLGIAAHDLKNPLQSIIGFAELITETESVHTIREMNAIVLKSSQRMLRLILDLLNTTTIESGKLILETHPVDVGALVTLACEHLQPQAETKGQTILTDIEPDCIVDIDAARMMEVFENLIGNAVKYSPLGGKISVSCHRVAGHAMQLQVKDDGQGLSEDDLKKLFGKFQRLSARPTGGESSTGLGLSIVKQLVELHGGKVWAASAGKGKGSTFFIELPAASLPTR